MPMNHRYAVPKTLLALALFVGACGTPVAEAPSPEPLQLRVVVLPYLSFAPLFIAQDEGYFAEQGLEVEFVKLSDSAEPTAALLQGDVDVAGVQVEAGVLNAIARGGTLGIVADKGYLASDACPAYALLARRALVEAGALDSASRLKGQRLAFEPFTSEGYYVEKLLAMAGLTFDDVTTEDLPPPALSEALGTGAVDLVHIGEPWITRILRGGNAVLWLPVRDVIPDFQWAVIVYGPNLLEENPDAGRRFMVAYLKAVRQYGQGKTERNLAIVSKHTELDRDLLEEACWPAIRGDGIINSQSVLDFQTWGLEKGLLDGHVTEEQFWDPDFIEYASQVLDESQP